MSAVTRTPSVNLTRAMPCRVQGIVLAADAHSSAFNAVSLLPFRLNQPGTFGFVHDCLI